jgi:hypothetical protein
MNVAPATRRCHGWSAGTPCFLLFVFRSGGSQLFCATLYCTEYHVVPLAPCTHWCHRWYAFPAYAHSVRSLPMCVVVQMVRCTAYLWRHVLIGAADGTQPLLLVLRELLGQSKVRQANVPVSRQQQILLFRLRRRRRRRRCSGGSAGGIALRAESGTSSRVSCRGGSGGAGGGVREVAVRHNGADRLEACVRQRSPSLDRKSRSI